MASKLDNLIYSILKIFYSEDKTTLYLILILLFGLILRTIAAVNLGVFADDMVHPVHAIGFINSGKLVDYSQSAGLWYSITDSFYSLFGVGQFTSRLSSVIFGTLSIILIFLLTKEFFNKKAGLIAAFLLAISPYALKNTVAEMDATVLFFILFGTLMFLRGIKKDKNIYFILSGIFFGLGLYTKVYALLFIPSLLAFALYKNYRLKGRLIDKILLKKLSIFLLFAFMFCIPTLAHNYLLYKDKGITDFLFTNTLGIGLNKSAQFYSWDAGWQMPHSWPGLFLSGYQNQQYPMSLVALGFTFFGDPLIFILSALGLIYCIYRKNEFFIFYLMMFIFAFPYLASVILLPKHYLFVLVLAIPAASFLILEVKEKIQQKLKWFRLRYVLLILAIISLAFLGLSPDSTVQHFYAESAVAQAMGFKYANVQSNDLMVLDSRMYTGRIDWIGYGKPFLNGIDFISLINQQGNMSGNSVPTTIYYFECVATDCGWGNVYKNQNLNKSMESLTDFFSKNGHVITNLNEPDKHKPYYPFVSQKSGGEDIRVYEATLNLNLQILSLASQPKNWFLYNIGHVPQGSEFDDYTTYSALDSIINTLAHWIATIALILALLSILYTIFLAIKEQS